jgi:histidyl-tRNA synthetase
LIAYFERHAGVLDADAQRRLHSNPLRILDTKNPAMQDMVAQAPQLLGFLGESSLKHFETVQALLTASGVAWTVNPRAVRGLDYYSHTVFEFITDELGAQGTLCGGGRYDGLFEVLGGKPTPAVGWGMGIERVLELLRVRGQAAAAAAPDAYAVIPDAAALPVVFETLQALRGAGVRVQMHAAAQAGASSMKSQFKRADSSGARFALVFGDSELAQGQVTVKALRDGAGAQQLRALADVHGWASTLQWPTA